MTPNPDKDDAELVEAVAKSLNCAALGQSPATRKRLATKAIAAARPILEAEIREKVLRELWKPEDDGSFESEYMRRQIELRCEQHGINLTEGV